MTDGNINKLSAAALLEQYESDFKAGDGCALINAVSVCLNHHFDAPKWVETGFNTALIKYASGESWTLDDAFNVQRKTKRRQKRFRKDFLSSLIWQKVAKYHSAGEAIGRALFELVAEELNDKAGGVGDGLKFNGTDVQEAYYAFKGVTKK